ncbi:AAA family ATPase [Streptomyces sp. BI20]|uniref:AAA family ATPase n=1 Tax=Streptomyces sp. BI20 TaxID=3403460 RepID=UPI003C70A065
MDLTAAGPPALRPAGARRATVPDPRPAPVGPAEGGADRAGHVRLPIRPAVAELRLSGYRAHRGARFALGPVTVVTGPSGSGKSQIVEAYEALSRLGAGDTLAEVFPDPGACVPEGALPDAQGRRGFRLGCTVEGPAGVVRLDLAVQAEPALRIAGERLSAGGQTLLTTAQRDPGRRTVQAAWLTGGATGVTRAPLPDDRLGTALLPLRVAGSTPGQRTVLAAAEQVVVALRSVFACGPSPERMRAPVPTAGGRLARDCANLADVLRRTRAECGTRHGLLVGAAGRACAGPVTDVVTRAPGEGLVLAELVRETGRATPFGRLGDGELRFLAQALVLLTGPGVLEVDPAAELLPARQALSVLFDGMDRDLDPRQTLELLHLVELACARGQVRVLATAGEAGARAARALPGVAVVDLGA